MLNPLRLTDLVNENNYSAVIIEHKDYFSVELYSELGEEKFYTKKIDVDIKMKADGLARIDTDNFDYICDFYITDNQKFYIKFYQKQDNVITEFLNRCVLFLDNRCDISHANLLTEMEQIMNRNDKHDLKYK